MFHLHQTGPPESTPIGIGVCAIPYNHSEFVTIGGVMSDDSVHGLVYRWKPNDTFAILDPSINSCFFTIFPSPPDTGLIIVYPTPQFLVWAWACLGLIETQCVELVTYAFLAPRLGWKVPPETKCSKNSQGPHNWGATIYHVSGTLHQERKSSLDILVIQYNLWYSWGRPSWWEIAPLVITAP